MPRRDPVPAPRKVDWRRVVHVVCLRKTAFADPRLARDAWRRVNDSQLRVYRCPFARPGPDHWHLGHVPTMRSLRTIAAAVRARAQEGYPDAA